AIAATRQHSRRKPSRGRKGVRRAALLRRSDEAAMTPPKAHKVRATKGEKATAARTLLVEHAAELLTLRGPGGPRVRETAADLGIVEDGAVYVEGDRIVDVGTASDVLSRHP